MYPVWSPDGAYLAFGYIPSGLQGEERFAATEIYTVKPDGTDLRRLTENDALDGHAYWW